MYNRLFFNLSNEKYIFYQLYRIPILYFSMHFIKQYEQRNRMLQCALFIKVNNISLLHEKSL